MTTGRGPGTLVRPTGVGAARDIASVLAALAAEVSGADGVTADSNFFDDIGADSMVMARFCARVRKRPDLPPVSMKDVYAHPTPRGLATALAPAPFRSGAPSPVVERVRTVPQGRPGSTAAYVLCGVLQLATFLGYTYGVAAIMAFAYTWIDTAPNLATLYLRAVAAGAAAFVAMAVLPIVAKWVLVGRWKARPIRIWSLGYFRFWLVKTLIRANPVLLVGVGSPLLPLYLRALGAHIGPRVTFLSRTVPVCTDLLTIGADTVIRKDAVIAGYRAAAGNIEIGPVTIGRGAFVGEASVLDIGTTMGDGAELGHASSLHSGQTIPDGQRWHGVPARRATAAYAMTSSLRAGGMRRFLYGFVQLLNLMFVYLPILLAGADLLIFAFPQIRATAAGLVAPMGIAGMVFEALIVSWVMFFGGMLLGLLIVAVVPRMLAPLIAPGREYKLYTLQYSAHRTIMRMTNLKFYLYVFGDSSYIVGYLRWIGFHMRRVAQTGSNFGSGVQQESPFLTTIGSGTMVADGLSVANAEFSSGSFRVSRVTLGGKSFLGNRIVYPVGGRTGENVLLATKVMVPVDGRVRSDVGLLGSPPFEIPRSVDRDAGYDHVTDGIELHRQLLAKNRHNRRTIGIALLVRWMHVFGLLVLSLLVAAEFPRNGALALAGGIVGDLVFTFAFFILAERAVLGFRRLQPRFCSIYDPQFWHHERFWKLVIPELDKRLAGTPFKNLVGRALGVRLGRRVFDDGCFLPERTLTTIGDDAVLNAGTVIQCHSQEDGTFKSDHTSLGARVTLGVSSFVHYGVTIGDDAYLTADAFLMKGEEVAPGEVWEGNPAQGATS